MDALPKNCERIIGEDFNMTEQSEDKSHDCGRVISELERFTWTELLNSLQVSNKYVHQEGPRFSWDNGQKGVGRRPARLDRLDTPSQSKLNIHHGKYFIYGYSVGSNYSPVHLELHINDVENVEKYLSSGMFITFKGTYWTRWKQDEKLYRRMEHSSLSLEM